MFPFGVCFFFRRVRIERLVFPPPDKVEQIRWSERLARGFEFAKCCSGSRFLVRSIIDRKFWRIAELLDMSTEDADAERMKRGDFRVGFCSLAEDLNRTLLHFACGLVGKSDGKNPLGRCAIANQMRNASRNDPSFSGAGTG